MTLTCLCDDLYALMTLCRLLGSLHSFLLLCNAFCHFAMLYTLKSLPHLCVFAILLHLCDSLMSLQHIFTNSLHLVFVVLTFLPLSHNSYSLRCLSALISALFAIYLSGSS